MGTTLLRLFILLGLFYSSNLWAEGSRELLAKDVFFEPGGGIRARYLWLQDGLGKGFPQEVSAGIEHRFQVDLLMHKGEFFQTFARLIHVNPWGRESRVNGDSNPGSGDSFSGSNGLFVNQAWGLWKLSENLGVRFGRSPIVLGSGKSYGANEWFNHPYTFDNFEFVWDWESVRVGLIGAKTQELVGLTSTGSTADPEENHYILDIEVRNTADWIKLLDFHFIQVSRGQGSADGGATELPSQNVQRFAMDFQFQTRTFTGETYLGFVSGDQNTSGQSGTVRQFVVDTRFSYNIPSWSNMNVYATGHIDSGDDDTSATNTEDRHFDSFYYDVYGKSGRMEFIRWGNLLSYSVGFDMEATSSLTLGAEFWSFSKVEGGDRMEFGQAGRFFQMKESLGELTFSQDKAIGSELDIFLNFQFPSRVNFGLTFSSFLPGATFRNGVTATGQAPSSTINQLIAEISLFF